MSDIIVSGDALDGLDAQAAPATRVRGYWQSVFYRLRHDPVTLAFGAIVLSIVRWWLSAHPLSRRSILIRRALSGG